MRNLIDSLLQDVRYSLRSLRHSPAFAVVTVASLALGIGANTAIFSLINAVLLKSLPVRDAQELVMLNQGSDGNTSWTNPIWEQIRDHQKAFDGVFASANQRFNLSNGGETRYVNGILASGSIFDVLGVTPVAGRTFTATDDRRGCPDGPVAVISYGFAQSEFGGPSASLGKMVAIDGHPFNIIGVTPPSFFGVDVGRQFDVVAPICSEAILRGAGTQLDERASWWLVIMGRLKPGSGLQQAQAAMQALQPSVREATTPANWPAEYLKDYLREAFTLTPSSNGQSVLRIRYSQALYVLMAVVGLVLLVACANIANLLLARSAARSKEMAVRVSMGASRSRLLRQLLVESIALGLIGAAAGALVAQWGSRILVSQLATATTRPFLDLSLDWHVLGFTAGVGILTGILFGMFPAMRATRRSPAETLREMSRSVVSSSGRAGASRWLVAIQVGISLVLLIGAALFIRSYTTLTTLQPGFDTSNVLLINVDIRRAVSTPEQRLPLYERMLDVLKSVPGVRTSAIAVLTPISGSTWNTAIQADGFQPSGRGDNSMYLNYVTPGYLETMDMRIVAGRDLNPGDTAKSAKVAVINEAAVRKFFGGKNPIGLTYRTRFGNGPWTPTEVVGVMRDAKYRNLREVPPPTAYLPFSQNDPTPGLGATFVAKGTGALLAPSITSAFGTINKDITITFRSFDSQVRDSLVQDRLMATLSALFGLLALTVAAVGLAGLVSYSINRRRSEIGIRAALGASPRSLVWLVLRDVTALTALGLAVGLIGSIAAGRFVASLLYGLKPSDPLTLSIAAVTLAVVSIVAGYIPARRAAKIDPIECLRSE